MGPEWNVGSMLVMQRGLVAASWVAGRRRVTREGIERGGRGCKRKRSVGVEVEFFRCASRSEVEPEALGL